jgi:hypothetical protein
MRKIFIILLSCKSCHKIKNNTITKTGKINRKILSIF